MLSNNQEANTKNADSIMHASKRPNVNPENFKDQFSLFVKKNHPNAVLPRRASSYAAGYDLTSPIDAIVPAHGKLGIDLGISISIPLGHYGRIAPRSGLAAKHFIDVGAGVIDCDYRGPLIVLLFNHADVEFVVKPGDRIAQLILERISTPTVESVEELSDTVRGSGGFGSTGIAN